MTFNNKILKLLQHEVKSHANFYSNRIIAIGNHTVFGVTFNDGFFANQSHEYDQWINNYKSFRSIQVLELEKNKSLMNTFKNVAKVDFTNLLDVCMFYSPTKSYSFNRHRDEYNVLLYVVKGRKKVTIGHKIHYLRAGQSIRIPKGVYHRVFNNKDTWAVSFAYK